MVHPVVLGIFAIFIVGMIATQMAVPPEDVNRITEVSTTTLPYATNWSVNGTNLTAEQTTIGSPYVCSNIFTMFDPIRPVGEFLCAVEMGFREEATRLGYDPAHIFFMVALVAIILVLLQLFGVRWSSIFANKIVWLLAIAAILLMLGGL